jgi:hypothetical protein
MTDNKLLAVNVFDDPNQQTTTTPETKTPEQKTTTPETNTQTFQSKDLQQRYQGNELVDKPAPVVDNTPLYGGLAIGFMILLLVGLLIIRKLNKKPTPNGRS